MKRFSQSAAQSALTLLELLVVLAILSILATVAVTSTAGFADQARYEATQRTLLALREALLGTASARPWDAAPFSSGFVSDMGRLPQAGGAGDALAELLAPPLGFRAYSVQAATAGNVDVPGGVDGDLEADPEVFLGTGWRGPYLQLAPGETGLRDGWGTAFHARSLRSFPVGAGDAIAQVHSFGSNGLEDVADAGYERDQSLRIAATDFEARVEVPVEVRKVAGNFPVATHSIAVRLFSPNPVNGRIFVTSVLTTQTGGGSDRLYASAAFAGGTGVPTPTAGLRAVRAYYSASGAPSTADSKSPVQLRILGPGQNVIPLVIVVP
jgi:prepilin-type N-terminal cleavage/methylation domain-containing protein